MEETKKKVVAKKKSASASNIKITFEDPLEVLQSGMSSIDLKRNAKGITEFNVKVYASSAEKAADEAIKLHKKLNKEFPMD